MFLLELSFSKAGCDRSYFAKGCGFWCRFWRSSLVELAGMAIPYRSHSD
ncbi:Uncharacterised protein [Vibrio cholerae]|nr:Uncharacterised protein [Vibrio cholerae]CSD37338.1 Uncharacterised protein [Vibrio cholerae]